jgi:hypothetical protein
MKKIIIITAMLFSLTAMQKAQSQVSVGVSYNTFYTALNPYGRWIDDPQYGHVWICNDAGFRPYYNDGHWEYTSYGWTWVSDYPWGWAPFHYGRWANINGYGWGWVPGYDWAPAWVSWCDAGDYYGWAPLGPGLGISISIGSIPADRWCFVPHQYINSPSVHSYYVDNVRNAEIYRSGRIINNVHGNYTTGPRRADVERVTHTTIRARTISYAQTPGRTVVNNNSINIYRPGAARNTATTHTNRSTTATHITRNTTTNNTAANHVTNRTVTHTAVNRTHVSTHHTMQQPQQRSMNMPQHVQHQQTRQVPQHANPPVQNHPPMQQNIHIERNPGGGGGAREPARRG